jgi:hypothetical protein
METSLFNMPVNGCPLLVTFLARIPKRCQAEYQGILLGLSGLGKLIIARRTPVPRKLVPSCSSLVLLTWLMRCQPGLLIMLQYIFLEFSMIDIGSKYFDICIWLMCTDTLALLPKRLLRLFPILYLTKWFCQVTD